MCWVTDVGRDGGGCEGHVTHGRGWARSGGRIRGHGDRDNTHVAQEHCVQKDKSPLLPSSSAPLPPPLQFLPSPCGEDVRGDDGGALDAALQHRLPSALQPLLPMHPPHVPGGGGSYCLVGHRGHRSTLAGCCPASYGGAGSGTRMGWGRWQPHGLGAAGGTLQMWPW